MTTRASHTAPPPLPVPVSATGCKRLALPASRSGRAAPAPPPLSSRLELRGTLNRVAQQPFCYASLDSRQRAAASTKLQQGSRRDEKDQIAGYASDAHAGPRRA